MTKKIITLAAALSFALYGTVMGAQKTGTGDGQSGTSQNTQQSGKTGDGHATANDDPTHHQTGDITGSTDTKTRRGKKKGSGNKDSSGTSNNGSAGGGPGSTNANQPSTK